MGTTAEKGIPKSVRSEAHFRRGAIEVGVGPVRSGVTAVFPLPSGGDNYCFAWSGRRGFFTLAC